MSFKLKYKDENDNLIERTATPAGNYSIVSTRKDHRYIEEFVGELVFKGEDFDWIMEAGECAEISITCDFRRVWKGIFAHSDALNINLSKKYIEIVPRPDDDYSKIEPWMGLDFNIIQPYKGIQGITKSDFNWPVMFEVERKKVRIDERYDGDVEPGKIWKGYSVNDWIKGGQESYVLEFGRSNSLIDKLSENINFNTKIYQREGSGSYVESDFFWESYRRDIFFGGGEFGGDAFALMDYRYNEYLYVPHGADISLWQVPQSASTDQDNQRLWLDYSGYHFWQVGGNLFDWLERHKDNSMWTLVEVINYYSSDDWDSWEYCELIYEREAYTGIEPPSGNVFERYNELSFGNQDDYRESTSPLKPSINVRKQGGRGWTYVEDDNKWYRRPLNAMNCYAYKYGEDAWDEDNYFKLDDKIEYGCIEFTGSSWTRFSCDGTWFTPLIEQTINGQKITKQVMYRNVKEYLESKDNWFNVVYPQTVPPPNHIAHKTTGIIEKFLEFIKDQQTGKEGIEPHTFAFDSQFFENEANPLIAAQNPNPLKVCCIIQNSDLKRPFATEKATKEEMSFTAFLQTVCNLFNCAWAIIDGKFTIEHISYFEQGLSYESITPNQMLINPYSIQNTAKNKNFMKLSDNYNYDKAFMPKFEIFQTTGGEEPINNKAKVEYFGGCINNKPRENTNEVALDTTTDVLFTRTEGNDAGITFLFPIPSERVGQPNRIFLLAEKDPIFGRYGFNRQFTLEKIIKYYHYWGRTRDHALLNGEDWENLTLMKNILQLISFPYVEGSESSKVDNPYAKVITGIGEGLINRVEYNAKTHMLEFQLAFGEVNPYSIPVDEEDIIDWHVHLQQSQALDTWLITHEMNSEYIMRPVVFDLDGNEITYNTLRILDKNNIVLTFSVPVMGRANFISLRLNESRRNNYSFITSQTWIINHNFGVDEEGVVMTPILDFSGAEMMPNEINYVDNNKIEIEFTDIVSGTVSIANVADFYVPYVNVYSEDIAGADESNLQRTANIVYNKPLVLKAGKEIFYNSHELLSTLRRVGFSDNVTAKIIVMEKQRN